MRGYSITKILNLPEYKITEVISESSEEIHIRVEPYKHKRAKCGGCGVEHNIGRHSQEETVVRDKPIIDWIRDALSSAVKTFRIIAESFKNKLEYIINWFKKKISSAISEGINNKIKRLKRMAYGYRDVEYFKLKIHQHCGLLNPRRYASF